MSQKLIEFLVHFSYNIIAYFYAKTCAIYLIYILQKFKEEMKIPAKIRSENKSRAQGRDKECRSRLEVMASQIKAVATEEHLLRPRHEGLSKKVMSRHRFEVATRKKDIVGRNGEIMSRPESNAEWTCNVYARQFQVTTKI